MNINNDKKILIFLFFAVVFFFIQGLNWHSIEYRDDEIFYYKSTSEMIRDGNFLSPTYFGNNRFQKPILFYWLVIFFCKILGISWFSARLVSVVFAALTVCLTWVIARRLFNRTTATLSSIILVTIPLFFRHAKNVVPDMTLNFFIVLAMFCVISFAQDRDKKIYRHLFFVVCALGFMVKGFAAIIVPFLTAMIYFVLIRDIRPLREMKFTSGIGMIMVIILPWFLYMIYAHGSNYTEYMLVAETQNRLFVRGGNNFIVQILTTFGRNFVFYLSVLFSYFAPWSLLAFVAVPFSMMRVVQKDEKSLSLLWMLVWFWVVFLFFSLLNFRINHYVLVLSTPFAILVSNFLLEGCVGFSLGRRIIKAYIIVVLCFGFLGLAFIHVFFAEVSKIWLSMYLFVVLLLINTIVKTKRAVVAPLILGLFIVSVLFQSEMLAKSGISAHATLQRFARTINAEITSNDRIGVGSHDLHEKEFQVYFDRPVKKLGTSHEGETRGRMAQFFNTNEKVYCLIIEDDYQKYIVEPAEYQFDVVQQDYIFRKRLYLDRGFLMALLKLDRSKVHDYLMEKVILVRKDKNV